MAVSESVCESERAGEKRERGEERGEKEERREEESGEESLCKEHKHNRQKGQRELVLTVIIINCSLRGVEKLFTRMSMRVFIYSP